MYYKIFLKKCFQFVSQFTPGVFHLHPIILPLVPCLFWGYPNDWSQVPSGGYQSPRSLPGVPESQVPSGSPAPGGGAQSQAESIPVPVGGVSDYRVEVTPRQYRIGVPQSQDRTRIPAAKTGLGHPLQPGLGYPRPFPGQVMLGQVTAWAAYLLQIPTGGLPS